MRILVDMDQVLADWGSRVIQYYNEDRRFEIEQHNRITCEPLRDGWTDLALDDIKEWDFKMSMGRGSEVYIRSYMRSVNFYRDLNPLPGALDGLRSLIDDGHDVMVATAIPKCAPNAYEGKVEWLRKNAPWFPLSNLIGISRKDALDADMLIDDGLHNIEPYWRKGRLVVLMDWPWNRTIDEHMKVSDRFWRAQGWNGPDGVLSCVQHAVDLKKLGALS